MFENLYGRTQKNYLQFSDTRKHPATMPTSSKTEIVLGTHTQLQNIRYTSVVGCRSMWYMSFNIGIHRWNRTNRKAHRR